MDILTPEERSRAMSRVHSRNTSPEITVRQALFAQGFRFRLFKKDLPGHPDIVLPKYRAVIFVHGCFWHSHAGCRKATVPKNNREFWLEKFARNAERDKRERDELLAAGWRVLWVWECALSTKRLRDAIGAPLSEWVRSDDRFSELDGEGLKTGELGE